MTYSKAEDLAARIATLEKALTLMVFFLHTQLGPETTKSILNNLPEPEKKP